MASVEYGSSGDGFRPLFGIVVRRGGKWYGDRKQGKQGRSVLADPNGREGHIRTVILPGQALPGVLVASVSGCFWEERRPLLAARLTIRKATHRP